MFFPLWSQTTVASMTLSSLSLQRSAKHSKSSTGMGTDLFPSRNWARLCGPLATCPMKWSWRSSSRGWTWTVKRFFWVASPFSVGYIEDCPIYAQPHSNFSEPGWSDFGEFCLPMQPGLLTRATYSDTRNTLFLKTNIPFS